ncbi:MAG: glycosyltransferase [Chitinophagales bacterium]
MEANRTNLTIAQVIDVFENAINGGGISTQRFTKLLRQHGHRVIVLANGEAATDKVTLRSYYPPIPFTKRILKRMKFVFAIPDKAKMEQAFAEADIVHNQFPLWLGAATVRIANKMNKPLVSTFHVQGEHIMYNSGLTHPFWTKLLYQYFVKYIYNKSDIVICPSKFAEQEIKRYGVTRPTVVISNGIPSDYRKMNIPKRYPEKFTILTVGRNAAEKRQEMLIRAIAASKFRDHIQLIILGDGPQRHALVKLSNELLNGNVEFNLVAQEKVAEYYNSVDLYVHTAAIEVECMTALEAMACGLPLLIADSALSATKQFAPEEKYLFKTQAELTKKIDYLFANRQELELAGKRYMELSKQYSIEHSYQQLLETYHKALKMHPITTPAEHVVLQEA